MYIPPNKEDYKTYSKTDKRVYWGFLIGAICIPLVMVAWEPYISPFFKACLKAIS